MYSGETVKNKFPVFVSFPTRTNFLLIKQIIIPKLPGYMNNKQKYERSECGYTVVSTDWLRFLGNPISLLSIKNKY